MREDQNPLILVDSEPQSKAINLDEKSRVQEVVKLHGEIDNYLKLSLEKAIRIGELLTDQKNTLKHGEFLPWLKIHMPFSDRTARNYMWFFKYREQLKSENVSDLRQAYRLRQLSWSGSQESGGQKDARIKLRLSLDADQNSIVMSAVDTAKDILDTDSNARALEHISYDWLQASGDLPELLPLEAAIRFLERAYNVQLAVSRNGEI